MPSIFSLRVSLNVVSGLTYPVGDLETLKFGPIPTFITSFSGKDVPNILVLLEVIIGFRIPMILCT